MSTAHDPIVCGVSPHLCPGCRAESDIANDKASHNGTERPPATLPTLLAAEPPSAVPDLPAEPVTLEYEWIGSKCRVTARQVGNVMHLDTIDPASATARQRFIKALVEKVPAVDAAAIEAELLRIADQPAATADSPTQTADPAPDDLLAQMPKEIVQAAEAMLADPLLIQRVVDDVAALGVAGEKELTLTVYLIGVSRLLERPRAGIVQGPSSSGKSYAIEKTASLFPPETVIHATQMTPQALFHMKPGSLSHRFIVGGERSRMEQDEQAEATRALREMLSAGKLTKLMPMKVEGGRIETVQIEQDGPIAYVETTTLSKVFDEDANRCLMLHTDEQPEQTRRIIRQLATAYGNISGARATEGIILRHHALQRMLEQLPVVVPFAERVGELIPSDRVETRRAFPHLMSMVQASALLHQRQRQRDANGAVVATLDDYEIVRHLLLKPMARLLGGGLSDPARRFHDRLKSWVSGDFTTAKAKLEEKSSKSAVNGWLAELHDAGLVELVEPSRGRTPATWRLAAPSHEADAGSLPAVEEVFPKSTWPHGHNAQPV